MANAAHCQWYSLMTYKDTVLSLYGLPMVSSDYTASHYGLQQRIPLTTQHHTMPRKLNVLFTVFIRCQPCPFY